MTRTILWSTVALAFVAGGCSAQQRINAEKSLAQAVVSDQDEEKLGLQVKSELDKQGVRYVTDPAITSYVQGIANKIIPSASKERPGVKWRVFTIDDPKTVNAFATPGGYMYVYTGLLLAADNEAEVAGVLGHEAGHVVARHSARQLVQAYGLQNVLGLALGKNPNLIAKLGSTVAAQGYLLKNSRGAEDEADALGVRYASLASYDPHGLVTFFQKLGAKEGKTPAALTWLSTHPPSAERVQHVQSEITSKHLGGTTTNAASLAPIKAKIQALPPVPQPAKK